MPTRIIYPYFQAVVFFALLGCNRVILYESPPEIPASQQYRVTVNNKPVHVYDTPVAFNDWDYQGEIHKPDIASFSTFDFTGKVNVRVQVLGLPVYKVEIRPLSLGIHPRIEGDTILFMIDRPLKLSIEINDRINHNLMLFANAPEQEPADPNDPDVLYFGPGLHEIASATNPYGIIELRSNQTVYLAGGAVLRARISGKDVENVSIRGRGILQGSTLAGRWPDYLKAIMGEPSDVQRPTHVTFSNSRNIRLQGIIIQDSPHWTVVFYGCEQVDIANIKLVGYVPNSDGIDAVNSRDIEIDDVFIRTGDDCIAIKGSPGGGRANAYGIVVKNSVFWADRGSALEIGHETNMEEIHDIRFENIDILNQTLPTMGYHAIDLTNADDARIYDISYDDIRVERCSRWIGIRIRESEWKTTEAMGSISGIHFSNISGYSIPDIHLFGLDDAHPVEEVTFENILYLGEGSLSAPKIYANEFVRKIAFIEKGKEVHGIATTFPVDLIFHPIDIAAVCNRSRTDQVSGDGKGWFDLGPAQDWGDLTGGEYRLGNIPFQIPDSGVLMLRPAGRFPELPQVSPEIDVRQSGRYLFFLHTTQHLSSPMRTRLWEYQVIFEDGAKLSVPVQHELDVADWKLWSQAGWQYTLHGGRVYVMAWTNPFPDKKIRSVRVLTSRVSEPPVLLGLTLGR